MSTLSTMIKQAVDNMASYTEKQAFTPAPGGQIPPPPPPGGDPMAGGMPPGGDPMAGGMPPGGDPMMGGMPPGGDPMMGGMPPMDPGMMGGAPPMDPGMMDPGMMEGPPPEEMLDEEGEHINDPTIDYDGSGKPDVMVPLGPITDFATSLIEATKGKRTADATPSQPKEEALAEAPMDPAMMNPVAHIGGAPADDPASIMPKMGAAREVIDEVKARRGY